MSKMTKFAFRLIDVIVIFVMTFGSPMSALAQVWTDPTEYSPGSTVTIQGDNSNGAAYILGETVNVHVIKLDNDWFADCTTTVTEPDPVGKPGYYYFACSVTLSDDPTIAVGSYEYTATSASGVVEIGTFTDGAPPSLTGLWQCDPPSVFDPNTYTCAPAPATGWVNGNDDGPFAEGETVPYRTYMTNLVADNEYSITIEWDTTKDGKHALDYLKTFNATIFAADPCIDLDPGTCNGIVDTFDIPADTFMQSDPNWIANSGVQDPGVFTVYSGDITGVSLYTTPADYTGNTSTSITIYFTAKSTSVALAWGGHIAEREDWGLDNSAAFIPGSPYHMRILSWYDVTNNETLNTGNTDRSLSAEAVIYPASITIVKEATPEGSTSFPFTASPSPLYDFTLVDDGTTSNTIVFTEIKNFQLYTVTEALPTGWSLDKIECSVTNANDGTQTVNLPSVGINLKEAENVTCTFYDSRNYNQDLTVTKTATVAYGRDYKWLIDKSVDDTRIEVAEGGKATFNYSVKVTPDGYTDSAWAVNGKITVANPNPFDVAGVNVTDAIDNGGDCTVTGGTNVTVPANSSVELDYSCSYSAAPSPTAGTNTATATWDAAAYYTPSGSDDGTASADFSTVTPSETNKTITVIDDKTDPANPVTLGTWNWADGEHTFTYSLDKSGVAGECTDYTNTAVIDETDQSDAQTVTVCVGKDLTVTKTADANKIRTYKWLIDKSVDDTLIEIAEGGTATFNYSVKVTPDGYTDSGYVLGGTITISNPNKWEDVTVEVADTLDQGGTCSITETAPYVAPKGGSLTLHYTCTTDGTTTKNTAAVTWDKATYFTPNDSASGEADVTFGVATETNKTITVVDDKTDPANPVTLGTWDWADGEHIFTYSLEKSGVAGKCTDYTNTAVIYETDQSDSQTVTVCVGKDLTVTKTVAGTFDRTYLWKISKDVDQTLVKIAEGGSYTFQYTVVAEQTGISDSGWTLAGVITIANPNDWEDITLTSLSDMVDNGGTCTVAPGPYIVLAGKSLDVAYSCSYASAPSSYSGKNTATATWDKAVAFTPSGSASGSADFTLSQAGDTNKTIHITDTYGGALGTVTATDVAPFATGTFIYERAESGVAGTCTEYDNTATITETEQSASKSVTLCVGKDLTVSKTAAGTFNRLYNWKIDKSVDDTKIEIAEGGVATFNYTVKVTPDGFVDSGWTLAGKITITNPNDWEDITADVTDQFAGSGVCTVTGGDGVVVPAGQSVTLDYSCTFGSQPTYSGKNTATATWDKAAYFTPSDTVSGDADVTIGLKGETNKTITIIDDKTDPANPVTLGTSDYYAGPFEFKYSLDKQGVAGTCTDYTNTAVIDKTDQSANQTVTVCVGKDLTVTKTAAGTFDRTYHWLIDKSVDDTRIEIAEGGTATFNYTVKVTPDGYADSGWTLGGTITVTNPNDWEDITADVTDNFAGGGVCTVTGGEDVVVEAGKSVTLNYSCKFASQPTYMGKNTATATWDAAAYFTPTGTAFGEADVTIGLKGETNRTITVVDDKTDPQNPVALGTSDFYVGPFEFKYSLDKQGVAGTCTDYTNTAVIDGTDQSDSQTVTVCVGKDLTVSKTAAGTFDRTYLWDISKDVDKTEVNIAEGGMATFNYTVDVEQMGITDSGWTLAGKITISNPNDWEDITLTSLNDAVDNGGTCTVAAGPYKVLAGKSLDVAYSCTYATAPSSYSGKNTATATWDKAVYFTPSGTASGNADFTLSQDGSTNKTVHVTDSYGGDLGTVTATDVAPFATGTFTYDRTESGVAGTCTEYDNTATITETGKSASQSVTLCVGKDLTVTKTAAGTFDRTYLWDISKDVDQTLVKIAEGGSYTFNYTVKAWQTGISDSNWTLAGKITISNPNDWEDITLTSLSDVVNNGGTCTVAAGPYTVLAGKSMEVAYSCTYATAPSGYSGRNTVTATWGKALYFTPSGTASRSADFTLSQLGSTNKTITVTDTYKGTLGIVTGTDTAPFASATFNYTRTEKGVAGTCTKYDNTATITETKQSASQTVTLCVGQDLMVSKTAIPTFTREFFWDISKDVDKTLVRLASGSAVFNYTVTVTETGFTDSAWKVAGTITISNPNNWEDIVANVVDALDTGSCTVPGGTNVTIPAGKSVTLNYTCDPASSSATKNTATATWDKDLYFTPSGTASGTANVAFTTPTTTVNETITVTDTFNGVTQTLGTATAVSTLPYTTKIFTYKRSVPVTFGCKSYTNTAEIVETGQNASQTIEVCGPINLGGKTMGFWQNKNGQAIILKSGPAIGTCNLTTWLRQFKPFQDLPAASNCTQAAAYVMKIIKAANASGASMNAMLKGQMLATALDVYFSDPALGGNKINAPAPIGGVTIDLTRVKVGTTYQNVSSAFGGAPSMTVMDMLIYAASQSNAGGSVWYANVKATQAKAKNAFDAINNNWVFAPLP